MIQEEFTLRGRVEAVLVAETSGSILTTRAEKIRVFCGYGVKGDSHEGTRLADVREREWLGFGLPKGVEIANHRQFSAVSNEELFEIKSGLGLPSLIPYGCLGENLVISGIPRLTELPPRTMLFFSKHGSYKRTAVLVVWGENTPCHFPGQEIQKHFPDIPGLASHFIRVAHGKRGIVGSVYSSGTIHEEDVVEVRVPQQRIYSPA